MLFIYFIVFIVLRSTPAYSDPDQYAPSSSNPPGDEQIDHVHFLVDDISKLYLDKEIADVVLVVDNEKFHAHRAVLASRSDYFKSMLYGKHKEAREMNVPIKEASANSFNLLLQYIYSGRMNLSVLEGDVIVELLDLSNYFQLSNLYFSLAKYLRGNISTDNVFSMVAVARLYQLKELEDDSLNYIDTHALDILEESEDYLSLSPEAFQLILNSDMPYAEELDIRIFRATCRWIEKNHDKINPDTKNQILSAVRYQFMNDEELSEVRRSQVVCSGTVLLESLTHALDYQEQLEPNVNFAQRILEEPTQIDGGTVIKLDYPSHINYIEMLLCDENARTYSYYIEVSMNQHDWLRIINHSKYHCRFVQRLWFHQRFVQYIRIVGTENTDGKTFKFLKIMYNTDKMDMMEIKNGLVAPKYNVASLSMNATTIKGISTFVPNTLVNGDYVNYDKDHGFTFHALKPSCIEVQLAQPYVLSSMRLLLWDCDSRTYGYNIEVSVNKLNWEMIIDKSEEPARSWQLLEFDARPIVYIRITGVHSSKNDGEFRCVHLEAPAQESLDSHNVKRKPRKSISRLFSLK